MKSGSDFVEPDPDTRTTSFCNFSAQRGEQRLNISPNNVGTYWVSIDRAECSAVLFIHNTIVSHIDTTCKCYMGFLFSNIKGNKDALRDVE